MTHFMIYCFYDLDKHTVRFKWSQFHSLETLSIYLRPKYQCSRRPMVWQTSENMVLPFAVA